MHAPRHYESYLYLAQLYHWEEDYETAARIYAEGLAAVERYEPELLILPPAKIPEKVVQLKQNLARARQRLPLAPPASWQTAPDISPG